jgi:GNAT superfamily N-acetyltransferase
MDPFASARAVTRLDSSTWAIYRSALLDSELLFPPHLRGDAEFYEFILDRPGSVVLIGEVQKQFAGAILAFRPNPETCEEYRLAGSLADSPAYLYIESLVVLPAYRGEGLARWLLDALFEVARAAGVRRCGGHFRSGASLHLFLALGGKALVSCPDWQGSGETYTYSEVSWTGDDSLASGHGRIS